MWVNKPAGLIERLIFALDMPTADQAKAWVERLSPSVAFYKVGLELFLSAGFPIVDWIIGHGFQVMLDLKLYDVPTTVKRALSVIGPHKARFATVHGDHSILKAAAVAENRPGILAVTVLTSLSQQDALDMGITANIADLVKSRACLAKSLGCEGVVCSPLEAAAVRAAVGPDFCIVTPGIRPASHSGDDQVRISTAFQAIADGADYLVVGRPIRDAADPLAVVAAIYEEISRGLDLRQA